MWFLSLTYECTPGFYYSLIPVKGVHLALLRYNAIKSPFAVYFFQSQWGTQWHSPGGKLKAGAYTCFSGVNLVQYHWFQWHNMWLQPEKAVFGGASPSPAETGKVFWENRAVHLPFFISSAAICYCPREVTRIDGSSVCPPKIILMLFCKVKISVTAPNLLIQPAELCLKIHFFT